MKSLMRSYVYWAIMDKDIENIVKSCKSRALAAKAPPIKYGPWSKTDRPWFRIHIEFAGRLDEFYYLIVVDSFSKWPELIRYKNPTTEVTINFLHELFATFGVVDCLVFDNGTQFTSGDVKDFFLDHFYHDRPISPKVQRASRAFH